MNTGGILEQYVDRCHERLFESQKALGFLERAGISERFVLESFRIGFSDGSLSEQVAGNGELTERLEAVGLLDKAGETLRNRVIIPILNEDRVPVNIVGISLSARSKHRVVTLGSEGVFNAPFLRNVDEAILTDDPLHALFLIGHGFDATTFVLENDAAFVSFVKRHAIRTVVFTFEGKERMLHELASSGITARRETLDFQSLIARPDRDSIAQGLIEGAGTGIGEACTDTIEQIENGFIFRFPLLHYRVIGSLGDRSTAMKVNIKAFTEDRVFVDSVDLYKHRDRERFIYNLIDRFDVRDQLQLDAELSQIVDRYARRSGWNSPSSV